MIQTVNSFLSRPDVQAFLDRPKVKPVLIFTGLGLLTSFIRTLVIDPNGGTALPIFSVWDVLLRLLVAVAWFAAMLIAIRPQRHSVAESLFWMVLSVGFAFLVTWADRPASALMIIPVVARYWMNVRQAVTLLLALLVMTVAMYVFIPPVPSFSKPDEWAGLVMLVVVTISQGAFTYAAFELLVQNEQKQQALNAANQELNTVNQQLRESQAAQMQAAALEERAFISREIHDTLGHELAALRLEVQRARKLETKTPSPAEPVLDALDGAMHRSGRALEQLQAVVSTLRTPQLDGTLFQSLQDLVQAWPDDTQLHFKTSEPHLTMPQKLAFYRGVQEALTNAHKHAPGQQVQVMVEQLRTQQHTELQIMIRNDKLAGETTPVTTSRSGGSGLQNLKERFEQLGGDVLIQIQEENFTVWLTLPVQQPRP